MAAALGATAASMAASMAAAMASDASAATPAAVTAEAASAAASAAGLEGAGAQDDASIAGGGVPDASAPRMTPPQGELAKFGLLALGLLASS